MPTSTGRAFTTANLLVNLAALKAINFGSSDPAGVWFVVPNSTTNNVEIWIWQPDSVLATDEISVVRPDSIVPGSPGRCIQRLKFDASQLGGILAAINALNTAGIIERTAEGGATTTPISSYMRGMLDDANDSTARTTLGLGFVNNTSDIDKPVSSQQQFALDFKADLSALDLKADVSALGFKANLVSPTFTGIPAVPTATAGTNTTQVANTAFVFAGLALKANLASPTFTGIPAVPTATAGTNTTQAASTAFVTSGLALKADLISPVFTGTPSVPTAIAGTSTTQAASTQFVSVGLALKANLESPTFTGIPAVPTATAGTSTTQAANTQFVTTGLATKADLVNGVIPASQLPSYVDDYLEFANLAGFPTTGESGKLYFAIDTNLTYRWTGTTYGVTSTSLALGTTSSTAYRGDFGDAAYLHSLLTGNPHGTTKAQVGLGNLTDNLQLTVANNLADLSARQIALNNLSGGVVANRFLRGDGTNITLSQVNLATPDITGILPIAHGGANNATYVDLINPQTIGGEKHLSGLIRIINTTQSTSTTSGAFKVDGGLSVIGNNYTGGFTLLGDNVAVKVKEITGTTGVVNSDIAIAHGITNRIKGVTCIVTDSFNRLMAPGMTLTGANNEYYVYATLDHFFLHVPPNNSANVASRRFVALITYST